MDWDWSSIVGTAKLVSLHGNTMRETNSIDDPERILPVESKLKDVSSHFHHTLPPYSIQVIQFDVE